MTDIYQFKEPLKEEFLESVIAVNSAISDFSEVVRQSINAENKSVVYEIIPVNSEHLDLIGKPYKIIERSGLNAVEFGLKFMGNYYNESKGADDAETRKLAGVIYTSLSIDTLRLHIDRINSAKAKAKAIITTEIVDKKNIRLQSDLRFNFIHHFCKLKYLVTSELYRSVVMIKDSVDSIHFGFEKNVRPSLEGTVSTSYYPKAKVSILKDFPKDITVKAMSYRLHNSLPIFLAHNSIVAGENAKTRTPSVRQTLSNKASTYLLNGD